MSRSLPAVLQCPLAVTDDTISGTRSTLGIDTDLTEFYFQAVTDLETAALLGPHAPPYWDEDDDLPRVVDVDPDVKGRIRALAHETGVADGLPAEWSLRLSRDIRRFAVAVERDVDDAGNRGRDRRG